MSALLDFLENEYKFDYGLRFLLKEYSVNDIAREIMEWMADENVDFYDKTTFARDFFFCIGLRKKEQGLYYNELKRLGFFNLLNGFLYHKNISVCSWSIYTFGKFSNKDNAPFLELAYETNYITSNPILARRCLQELRWLKSRKASKYLKDLESEGSLTSKLILLYYWEVESGSYRKLWDLLDDKIFFNFMFPGNSLKEEFITEEYITDLISAPMMNFEQYFFNFCDEADNAQITHEYFEQMAASFFASYREPYS